MLTEKPRKPKWLKVKLPTGKKYKNVREITKSYQLHTICESGNCPNMGECWGEGTATFMILGNICTRSCGFCNVKTGRPLEVDVFEPLKIANSIKIMKVKHAVITSVDRDDLIDGGANHFFKVIVETKKQNPETTIEVLTPDFLRKGESYKKVIEAQPDVFNHNIETVPGLYRKVRPGSRYFSSVELLKNAKKIDKNIFTKSGLMVGLGENKDEIIQVLDDLRSAEVDFLTIGQYLQPSSKHHPLQRYYNPEEFEELKSIAESKGFLLVSSSPLTRSSYHADEDFFKLKKNRINQTNAQSIS